MALERVEQPRELRRGVVEHGHEREAGAGRARAWAAAEQQRVCGAHRRYAQVALGTGAGRGARRRALQDARQGAGRGLRVAGRVQAAAVRIDELGWATRVGGHHRHAARERLGHDHPVGLALGAVEETGGRGKQALWIVHAAGELDPVAQVGTLGAPAKLGKQALALGAERLAGHRQAQLRQLARRERDGLERQVGALPGLDRAQQQHPLLLGPSRRRPEALEVDTGVDHAQPLTELGARVEVAGDALRGHHDQLGLARAAPQRASDKRAGQQVVVLEDEPGAGRRRGKRSQAGAHAPRHDRVRAERAKDRAQLGGLSGEPAERGRALSGAATQLEAALAQLEHPDPAFACGVCERSRRAGDQRRLLEPRGDLEQNALGAAEQAGVADCDRRHAGAS